MLTLVQYPTLLNVGQSGFVLPEALNILHQSVGWWEADNASNVHSGGLFSQLTDLSGNGNHLTQATGSLQPARTDTGGVISAEFDGVDDILGNATPTAALMNNFNAGGTAIWAFRSDGAGSGAFERLHTKNVGEGFDDESLAAEDVGAGGMRPNIFYTYTTIPSRGRLDTPQLSMGTKYIIAERVDKTTNDADLVLNVGLTEYTYGGGIVSYQTESGTPRDNSSGVFEIGGKSTVSTGNLDGGIYAGAFWGSILADEALIQVINYWAGKFGITV